MGNFLSPSKMPTGTGAGTKKSKETEDVPAGDFNICQNQKHLVVEKAQLDRKRVIIVGDVHGCLDELVALLQKCNFDANIDQLVLVGDLVNKGPKSAEVVQYVRSVPHVLCVLGNHDEALLKEVLSKPAPLRPAKYAYAAQLSSEDISWLTSLPCTLTLEAYNAIIVHAGLVPHRHLQAQTTNDMTKMRNVKNDSKEKKSKEDEDTIFTASESVNNGGVAWASVWPGPQHVYFGHDAVRGIQEFPFATGLDTGCCYGRSLSAMILPEKCLVQVQAFETYQTPGGS